jgi:hypothetical protein
MHNSLFMRLFHRLLPHREAASSPPAKPPAPREGATQPFQALKPGLYEIRSFDNKHGDFSRLLQPVTRVMFRSSRIGPDGSVTGFAAVFFGGQWCYGYMLERVRVREVRGIRASTFLNVNPIDKDILYARS